MCASSTLTLSASDGAPGDSVILTANLSTSDAIVAAEVVIPLGKYISYVPSSAVLASARSNGHVLTASQVGEELRVYIYSMALQPLQGTEGVLFTCDLAVGNKPLTQILEPQVVLSDAEGASLACSVQSTSITILAPEMKVLTKTLDYGHIPIRSDYTQPLSIANTGTQPLTISSVSFTDAEFSTTNLPTIIPAGATQSIDINYSPMHHGAVTATLTIYSDAVNGMYNNVRDVTLVANPFSVNELHVGNGSGIADDTISISLTMNNMESITAGEVRFMLPSALQAVPNSFVLSERAVDHQTLTRVVEDTLILYFYSPTNAPLAGNDGELGTFDIRLNGTSGYYELNPMDVVLANSSSVNMVSASSSGYATIQSPRINTSYSLSFGEVSIVEATTAILDVSNDGDAPLVLERVTFLAEGYSCLTLLPIIIEPWSSSSLQVQYIPSGEGCFGTTMQVYSNDPINRMHSVALSGTVYEPNTLSLSGLLNGDTCTLSVSMDNYSDIAALQFDISGLAENDVVLTPSARLSQHTALLIPMTKGAYRIAVYNLSNASITDHDGEIIQIRFPIIGWSTILSTITNIVLSNPLGQNKCSTPDASWSYDTQTALEPLPVSTSGLQKILYNGKIYILRGDRVYTLQGQEVR